MDERPQHPCAAFATDEEIQSDPDVYDCGEDCPVHAALEDLWPENAEAWRLYHSLVSRFVADLGAGAEALRRATSGVADGEAWAELLERLSLIYDLLCPPSTPAAKD